jgi:hypothetical protein
MQMKNCSLLRSLAYKKPKEMDMAHLWNVLKILQVCALLLTIACVAEEGVTNDSIQEPSKVVHENSDSLAAIAVPLTASNVRRIASLPIGITAGPFLLKAQHSGKCLDVTGGEEARADGVPVQQWECLLSRPLNQLWDITPVGDGVHVYVMARHSGKCLDVTGGPSAVGDGVFVQQWTCLSGSDNRNQRWRATASDNIVAMHSSKCLDVRGGPEATGNGARLQQWRCFSPATENQIIETH